MRVFVTTLCALAMGVTCVSCSFGSNSFSQSEIQAAKDVVIKRYEGIKYLELVELHYDEKKSNEAVTSYMKTGGGFVNGVERKNVIILFADFRTDSSEESNLSPNTAYTDCMWILIRDDPSEPWRIDGFGW